MWAEAGQDPARFWEQTPASFGAIISGVRRRARREREERLTLAWEIAAMSRAEKLKPLSEYLEAMRPKPKRSILAKLRDAVARGAPMTIARVGTRTERS